MFVILFDDVHMYKNPLIFEIYELSKWSKTNYF